MMNQISSFANAQPNSAQALLQEPLQHTNTNTNNLLPQQKFKVTKTGACCFIRIYKTC
jgi:hypothetical protein